MSSAKREKVFCVGRNKTGTTSLKKALHDLGYRVGNQREAELLIEDWGKRDFRRLTEYCKTADAFQDVPFSLPFTFQAMDMAFPGSKFILTIRDSADQWYKSLVRFHSKRVEQRTGQKRLETFEDIKSDPYIYLGYRWRVRELVGVAHNTRVAYPEKKLKDHYNWHNSIIAHYFRHRPNDFLVLNVAKPDSMRKLCDFLSLSYDGRAMPKLNQSRLL